MENIVFKTLNNAIHVEKETGTTVDYYISDEYEIHFNKIMPHTTQDWHFHSHIQEILFVLKGKLLCHYLVDNEEILRYLHETELVEVGNMVHVFENDTDEIIECIVFRFVPQGMNQRECMKNDKTIVER